VIVAASVLLIVGLPSAFAQMDEMEMSSAEATVQSPIAMTTEDGTITVGLSWEPETINIEDQPTTFTIEFLDAETEERLQDVTYSIHMTIDGRDLGHGHEGIASDGIVTMEQQFDSVGALGMVIEIHSIDSEDVSQFAQFSVTVAPELPVAAIALAVGVAATTGLSMARARSLI
jgi:hypothetical protein